MTCSCTPPPYKRGKCCCCCCPPDPCCGDVTVTFTCDDEKFLVDCSFCQSMPETWELTFTGTADAACSDCDEDYDGTYTLDYVGSNTWESTSFSTGCFGSNQFVLTISEIDEDSCEMFLELNDETTDGAIYLATISDIDEPCDGPISFGFISGTLTDCEWPLSGIGGTVSIAIP